ncbi:hypothetical protein DWB77_01666 [Streptomyces hundungensis]|uniref:Uncharacterized protein n=1 Tax=Streptomyces hundungensis TaxID=1077946 RepID=A0A387HA70_9ACTN|nr:hypothetical protein [Streptomyces hundungensis]AYG79551.1 hypothetical protein DWB77_01666 [Streptomyces hundungensis]
MTPSDRPAVPRQSPPPDEKPPETRQHMIRRRWITAVIIVLLIGVPAGYLAISAEQSRTSGRDKESEASARGLQKDWPSKTQRRIYEVPVPTDATDVAYYETNSWKVSKLYVQFTTNAAGLAEFMKESGTSTAALKPGDVTIGPEDARRVGWTFPAGHDWAATTHAQKDPLPTQNITVDETDPDKPVVFVVSTATP